MQPPPTRNCVRISMLFFNEEDEKLLRSRLEIPTLQNLCLPVAGTDPKVLQSIKSKPLQDELTGSENFIGHFLREYKF